MFTLTYALVAVGVPLLVFVICLIPGHIYETD
jgi:hypothetical protein